MLVSARRISSFCRGSFALVGAVTFGSMLVACDADSSESEPLARAEQALDAPTLSFASREDIAAFLDKNECAAKETVDCQTAAGADEIWACLESRPKECGLSGPDVEVVAKRQMARVSCWPVDGGDVCCRISFGSSSDGTSVTACTGA